MPSEMYFDAGAAISFFGTHPTLTRSKIFNDSSSSIHT
jgi:hypothetical protein